MSRILTIIAVLALSTIVTSTKHASSHECVTGNGVHTCPPTATCCHMDTHTSPMCCPHENGQCCANGRTCCPPNSLCNDAMALCIQVTNSTQLQTASDMTVVESPSASSHHRHNHRANGPTCAPKCDRRETCCGGGQTDLENGPLGSTRAHPGKCCVYPDGVCCSDGRHCCPRHSYCDLENGECRSNRTATGIPLLEMGSFRRRRRS